MSNSKNTNKAINNEEKNTEKLNINKLCKHIYTGKNDL